MLKLASPCFCVASIAPRPIAPNPKDAPKAQGTDSPCDTEAAQCWRVNLPMPLLVMAVGGKVVLVEVVADPAALELSERAVEAAAEVRKQTRDPDALMRQVFAQLLEQAPGLTGLQDARDGAAATASSSAAATGGAAAASPRADAAARGSTSEAAAALDRAHGAGDATDGGGDAAATDEARDNSSGEAPGRRDSSGAGGPAATQWTQRVMVRPRRSTAATRSARAHSSFHRST